MCNIFLRFLLKSSGRSGRNLSHTRLIFLFINVIATPRSDRIILNLLYCSVHSEIFRMIWRICCNTMVEVAHYTDPRLDDENDGDQAGSSNGVSQYGIIWAKHALNIPPDFLLTHTHGKSWMNPIVSVFMCKCVKGLWIYLFVKHKVPPPKQKYDPNRIDLNQICALVSIIQH